MQKPTIGRIVHYHKAPKKSDKEPYFGPYAAIVAATKEENEDLPTDTTAMLKVFDPPNGNPDHKSRGDDYYIAAEFSESPAAGCWSWPPKV